MAHTGRLQHIGLALGSSPSPSASATAASPEDTRPPVCLVIGGGRGIGGNVARRFARDGYTACVVLRSNAESMEEVVSGIQSDGNTAHGFLADGTDEQEINSLVACVLALPDPADPLTVGAALRLARWRLPGCGGRCRLWLRLALLC